MIFRKLDPDQCGSRPEFASLSAGTPLVMVRSFPLPLGRYFSGLFFAKARMGCWRRCVIGSVRWI